ncbi:MAG TPA: hypothetical protein PLQ11_10910 [Beijerinckiaceae bacterium]|nr:hypothetical protein [Beijerinckiaceae bacterium]
MSVTAPSTIGETLRGLVRQALKLFGGVLALGFVALFSDDPLLTFFKMLSIAGTVLMLMSVALMLVTFRRARVLAPAALLTTLAVSLASTLISLWLGGGVVDPTRGMAALASGGLIGWAWASTMLLFVDEGVVRGRGTLWHLAIWAVTFAINQLAAVTGQGDPGIVQIVMLASAGIAAGHAVGLSLRIRSARALALHQEG